MNNPFKHSRNVDPATEQSAAKLLAPLAAETPSEEARTRALQSLASAEPAPASASAFGLPRRAVLAGAVLAPLMAISAVGAAAGTGNLPDPVGAASNALGIGGNSGDVRQDFDHRSDVAGDFGQPGSSPGQSASAPAFSAQVAASATAGAQASAAASQAEDAHANGKGCDDVNPAVIDKTPTPGGPADCTVGSSGDHRKNGQEHGPGAEESATPANEQAHANGKGCDDVNPAVIDKTPTPGGPADCEVGSSGDHRKNGQEHGPGAEATASPAASPMAAPAQGGQAGPDGQGGPGGAGSQGSGKGKNK